MIAADLPVRPHKSVRRYGGTPNCIGGGTPGVGSMFRESAPACARTRRALARPTVYHWIGRRRPNLVQTSSNLGGENEVRRAGGEKLSP